MSEEDVTYESLENTDVISVELVPERKGLILKHCEYFVSSRRHGTTVTRRYNDFVQLYDVLSVKYPYRAVCRLPPKRVVVGGGSVVFLRRRRAALERWLSLVARHPILAHDADTRAFLTERGVRLDKPKHDEFALAGIQPKSGDMTTDQLQAAFAVDQEQLRLLQLGLGRLFQIFEKLYSRCSAERSDVRELGAALAALSTATPTVTSSISLSRSDTVLWAPHRDRLRVAASACDVSDETTEPDTDSEECTESSSWPRLRTALEALTAHRELCARLTRGVHAERFAASSAPTSGCSAAAAVFRNRHWYALRCAMEEARMTRAYTLSALEAMPDLFRGRATAHAQAAKLWANLHTALVKQ